MKAPDRRRLIKRLAWAAVVVSTVTVFALPTIVARTPLRNLLLSQALAKSEMRGSTRALSLSWWGPVVARGVEIERNDERLRINVEEVQLAKSWLSLLVSLPNVGHANVQSPTIQLEIDQTPPVWPTESRPAQQQDITLHATIEDAALQLSARGKQQPLLELDDLDLSLHLRDSDEGRLLEVDPTQILDHQQLTPALFDQGLQLIAPLLGNSAEVEGYASLSLERFQIPLEPIEGEVPLSNAEIRGELELHQVSASLKDAVIVDVARYVTRLFQLQLPNTLRLVDDTVVRFELQDGRVAHDGLAFLIPELSQDLIWKTRGSVGFDESLDLEVELRVPIDQFGSTPLLQRLANSPIRLKVEGTLDNPELRLPDDSRWIGVWGAGLLQQLKDMRQRHLRENEPSPNGVKTPPAKKRTRWGIGAAPADEGSAAISATTLGEIDIQLGVVPPHEAQCQRGVASLHIGILGCRARATQEYVVIRSQFSKLIEGCPVCLPSLLKQTEVLLFELPPGLIAWRQEIAFHQFFQGSQTMACVLSRVLPDAVWQHSSSRRLAPIDFVASEHQPLSDRSEVPPSAVADVIG